MRETVFNWLAPYLPGAACLDLFAGSGAFGFEALSRGAARAVLVEKRLEVVAALRHNREQLKAEQADIVHADAVEFLRGPAAAFDIVFLDPPYASGLLGPLCRIARLARLAEAGRLHLPRGAGGRGAAAAGNLAAGAQQNRRASGVSSGQKNLAGC